MFLNDTMDDLLVISLYLSLPIANRKAVWEISSDNARHFVSKLCFCYYGNMESFLALSKLCLRIQREVQR